MVAAVRPRLENHRPEKMAPSFNLLPRLARVMGSVLPQLGRQHFSSIHYFDCPILNDVLTVPNYFPVGVRKLVRLSPETHGLLIR